MQELSLEIKKVNQLCDEGFSKKYSSHPPVPKNLSKLKSVLDKINVLPKALLTKNLGDFGKRLKIFSDYYDYNHPHVAVFLANNFSAKLLFELDEVISLAEQISGYDYVSGIINQAFDNNRNVKNLSTLLFSPPIRMLKNKEDRDFVRNNGFSNIDMNTGNRINASDKNCIEECFSVSLSNSSLWFCDHNSFDCFARLNEFQPNTDKHNKMLVKLKKMGLACQADLYSKKIKEIENKSLISYCGFKQIQLPESSIILGKVNEYKFIPVYLKIGLESQDTRNIDLLNQLMPSNLLMEFICNYCNKSYYNDKVTVMDFIKEIKGEFNINDFLEYYLERNKTPIFSYQPRLYPMHAFSFCSSSKTTDMLNSLDNFADYQGHVLFDSFYVLVPGIDFEHAYFSDRGKYKFKIKNKSIEIENKKEALFLIDAYMVKNKLVCPIIVGKKDNEFYFVRYWED